MQIKCDIITLLFINRYDIFYVPRPPFGVFIRFRIYISAGTELKSYVRSITRTRPGRTEMSTMKIVTITGRTEKRVPRTACPELQ